MIYCYPLQQYVVNDLQIMAGVWIDPLRAHELKE